MSTPIRIHPKNPKLFEFRGKPLVLITATEHYGSVINRPFRFERYLGDAAENKMTLTRLFTLFREHQFPLNPYSTCKPESPDYITPFKRVGPEKALDGQPQYDLDQWNPEFFDRLHRFLSLASDYGIIVEITLLSNTYVESVWELNPLHPKNNINGTEEIHWSEYTTIRHPRLFARQAAHVRKIVQETNKYDNVIFEICNEPGGNVDQPGSPTTDEVNDWLIALGGIFRETESGLPNKHLIAGQEAFAYSLPDESQRTGPDVHQFADKTFDTLDFIDVANMHPLSNMISRSRHYDLGRFMWGQLRLQNLRQYCLDLHKEAKPFNLDEDNAASQYKDFNGWTIHRKRAWTILFCGGHYDTIDFSINNYLETGTPDSRRHIRRWMKHLSDYIHSIDLVGAKPAPQVVQEHPRHVVPSVMAVDGKDYSIYLADGRESDALGAGENISCKIVCDLPEEDYMMSSYSPVTGVYSPLLPLRGGKETRLFVPEFAHDIVVRIQKR